MSIAGVLIGGNWGAVPTPPPPADTLSVEDILVEELTLALLKTAGKYDSCQDQATAILKLLNAESQGDKKQ